MTKETSSTLPMLLDSRDALQKSRRLNFYVVSGLLTNLLILFVGIAISALNKAPDLTPTIVVVAIFGIVSFVFIYNTEAKAKKAYIDAKSWADSGITSLLNKKYSIRLLEPVRFNLNETVSRTSLDYITVSKDPLRAVDSKTGKNIQVILSLSSDRTDVEAAILSVASAR